MNAYYNDLTSAVGEIREEFYFTRVLHRIASVNSEIAIEDQEKIQQTENQFSAELYHQWRNLIEGGRTRGDYTDLMIGFDLTKKNGIPNFIEEDGRFRPDLVLHKSQLEHDQLSQKLIIEVKTNPYPEVRNDVLKLVSGVLFNHFELGVFISVNSDIESVKKKVRAAKNTVVQKLEQHRKTLKMEDYDFLNALDWSKYFLIHSEVDKEKIKSLSFNTI